MEKNCFMVLMFIVIEIAKSDVFETEMSMLFPYTFIVTLNCSAQPLSFSTSNVQLRVRGASCVLVLLISPEFKGIRMLNYYYF